jgi:benzoylsuccinyl-CoA thiolase BbsB subunit
MSGGAWITGVGMTPFGRDAGVDEATLAWQAVGAALADAGVDQREVDAVFVANVFGGPGLGQRILAQTPLAGRPIVNVENACASGTTAVLEARAWVEAGMAEMALVVGVEVLTGRFGGGMIPVVDDLYVAQGLNLPALYALKARDHMERFGTRRDQFALVSVKNRAHGARNPMASTRSTVTVEEVLTSRPIADPITLLQCCRNADGAAAVVVVSAARARHNRRAVRLAASRLGSGRRRAEIGWDEPTVGEVARAAYEAAGIGPAEVDVAEVHDSFAPSEIFAYERLGFSDEGAGGFDLERGRFTLAGEGPAVNPSGGLLSRGHPPGATGAAQLVEIVTQLRGESGARQVEDAAVGLTLTLGGNVPQLETNACAVHVLTR